MNIKNLIFWGTSLFLISCQQTVRNQNDAALKEKPVFSERKVVKTHEYELDSMIVIDEWSLYDNQLICKSRKNDFFFYHFDLNYFSCRKAWGTKGEGPDEFIAPYFLSLSPTSRLVIDNGKRKVFLWEGEKAVKTLPMPANVVSSPLIYNYPLIGYKEQSPQKIVWRLQNMETSERTDSLIFTDDSRQGKSALYDFCWNIHGKKVVCASLYEERFMVAEIQNDKLVNRSLYCGSDLIDEGKPWYSDVQCTDDSIYLLSQQMVDMSTGKGYSVVEIYDYDGNPKMMIELDIIARRMLIDAKHRRLLFHSPMDDVIHVLDLE